MEYVNINGLSISKLTLGTVQLGLEYGIANKSGKPDEKKSFAILREGEKGGINAFDTAQAYGDSEEVLGRFFSSKESLREEKPVIITKLSLDFSEKLDRRGMEREIWDLAERSLKRLGINKLPILMLHHGEDMDRWGDVVPRTLERLVREGLVGMAGVSVYTVDQADRALEEEIYQAIQIPMNIFDHRFISSGALNRLKDSGMVVFVRSVFLQGLFFLKPEALTGTLAAARQPLEQMRRMAKQEGMSIAQLAISYIRDLEGVTSLVIGAETPQQVVDNLSLIEGPSLGEDIRNKIYASFENLPVELLNPSCWKR